VSGGTFVSDSTLVPTAVPSPVGQLVRRSEHAKSHRDRHDTLYFAFELSIRLSVAVAPPPEAAGLARAGIGAWAAAAARGDEPLRDERLLRLREHLDEVVGGVRTTKRTTTVKGLLQAVAAYRNKVIGHGSVRSSEFYALAAARLAEGLRAAWDEGVFSPAGARWAWSAEFVEGLDAASRDPEFSPPKGKGAHVGWNGRWRSLHPWVVCDPDLERFWFFNGIGRRAEYLDYLSGDTLSGDRLAALDPELEQAAIEVFGRPVMPTADHAERDPNRVGDFRLLGKLGSGGMGEVYLARQESLERLVALKLLPPHVASDSQARARFRREVQALSRCDHQNVVKILAFGESRGAPYYAMECIEGPDLARVLRSMRNERSFSRAAARAWRELQEERDLQNDERGPVEVSTTVEGQDSTRELARYVRDAALGLEHLHQRGILHRDISPANLMVTWPERRAVLMDLGLAALEDASVSLSREGGKIVGTLRYLSPEQLVGRRSEIDERSDVYSLGAVLFELVCGRPLNDGEGEASVVHQILDVPTPRPRQVRPDLSRDLATIVAKATERERHLRYPSAGALAEDLDAWLGGRPISARPPTPTYLIGLAVRRNRGIAGLTVAAFLAVVLGLASLAWSENKRRRELDLASDTYRVPYLLDEADKRLWPCTTRMVPIMERWVDEANAVLAKRSTHLARLAAMTDAEAEVDRTSTQALVDGLDALSARIDEVRGRMEFAHMASERLRSEDAGAWAAAIRSISDVEECPAYGGRVITPQEGLVPIGRDPDSGLWEFSHFQTGAVARRATSGMLDLRPENGLVMVLVPGGPFWMGSQTQDPSGRHFDPNGATYLVEGTITDVEGPVVWVDLDPYFVSKFEMTRAQWAHFTSEYPSGQPVGESEDDRLRPVEQVTQIEAREVLERLGLTLPTEAQWEHFARAGTETTWPTGSEPTTLKEFANLADVSYSLGSGKNYPHMDWDDGVETTTAVGSYFPNAFGLYDTLGNVWEWCADSFTQPAPSLRPGDGFREVNNGKVLARGGCYSSTSGELRATYRYILMPQHLRNDHGVRPVRRLDS
jgi:serine/threonine protein kinase/formylglycine-generating enzyme required for sulfatase activity